MEKQRILTQEEFDKLSAELDHLKTEGRTEAAERLKVARSFGDLSENAEYDEARNDQAKLEASIARLEAMLSNCVIQDESEITDVDTIRIGSIVKLFDKAENEEVEYKIAGKSDLTNGIISDQSPVGAALMGKKAGDTVDVVLPSELIEQYDILSVKR